MLTSIMNIKYNVDNLCRYNVKKYEYNIGSEKNNQIKMLDKVYNLVILRNFMILIVFSWSGPSAS
jgi:hypothetical protein